MIASSPAYSHSFVLSFSSSIESFFCYPHFLPFLSFAVPAMAQTKSTANPPSSSRNPPPNTRRVTTRTNRPPTRNPPRASSAPSSLAERPASSHANPTQATPPQAGGVSLPSQDYKELYPWASPILSFHKEHDSKVTVLPCLPGEPIYVDDKRSNGELFCFIYATLFKNCLLYTSPSPRD